MAIIGFIVLVLIGLYCMYCAVAMSMLSLGFAGKMPWAYFIVMGGLGTMFLYFAVVNSPVHVTFS